MNRLPLLALLLLAGCGPSGGTAENEAVQRGIERSVADVEAATAATAPVHPVGNAGAETPGAGIGRR